MRLLDEYRYPGYRPRARIRGVFGDPRARVIGLDRVQKKRFVVVAGQSTEATTTGKCVESEICPAGTPGFIWKWKFGESYAGSVER